jgi:cardiolipin synthase
VSTVGKVLDPAADRLLVATGVVSIMVYGAVPNQIGTLTLAREVLVGGMTLLLASLGARRIDVLWVGKAGTFGLMWAYPSFLLSYGSAGWQQPIRVFAWVAGIGGLTLAYVAAVAYIRPARQALVEGRKGRRMKAEQAAQQAQAAGQGQTKAKSKTPRALEPEASS